MTAARVPALPRLPRPPLRRRIVGVRVLAPQQRLPQPPGPPLVSLPPGQRAPRSHGAQSAPQGEERAYGERQGPQDQACHGGGEEGAVGSQGRGPEGQRG